MVSYRQGYGSNPRSKSCPVPAAVLRWLEAGLATPADRGPSPTEGRPGSPQPALPHAEQAAAGCTGPEPEQVPAQAVVAAALALLRPVVAPRGWQLTRLAVALAYDGSGSAPAGAPAAGQLGIAAFVQKGRAGGSGPELTSSPQPAASLVALQKGEGAAADDGSSCQTREQAAQPLPQPFAPTAEHRQQRPVQKQQQQQQEPERLPPGVEPLRPEPQLQRAESRAAPFARPPSYRNAEALALQKMFCAANVVSAVSGQPAMRRADGTAGRSAAGEGGLPPGLSPEEQASLELALKLQAEEAAAAAALPAMAATGKRGPTSKPGGKVAKQQRRGSGPLDAFLRRANS